VIPWMMLSRTMMSSNKINEKKKELIIKTKKLAQAHPLIRIKTVMGRKMSLRSWKMKSLKKRASYYRMTKWKKKRIETTKINKNQICFRIKLNRVTALSVSIFMIINLKWKTRS
jgi:hypothetical protein